MTIIKVQNVSVSFGDVQALSNVNLQVAQGQIHGLLGPNGAGKTTLVNVISTLLQADSGLVTVAGYDAVKESAKVRASIGLAGQYAAVDEVLTGRENLEIIASLYQLRPKEAKRRASDVLERLSLTDAADRLVRTYSGGMRRRLDLGACLVGRPKILLLDEPTTGLDPRTRIELWDFLRDLVAEGATVLLTTQYLEEADELADEITVIDHGRVIAQGTSDRLKDLIGGSILTITPRSEDDLVRTQQAISVLNSSTPRIDTTKKTVSLVNDAGAQLVVAAASLLEKEDIEIAAIKLEQPTLDEVFLQVTGQPNQKPETADHVRFGGSL